MLVRSLLQCRTLTSAPEQCRSTRRPICRRATHVIASPGREGFALIRSDLSFERWSRTVGGILLPQVLVGTFRVRKTSAVEKSAIYPESQGSPGHHTGCSFPAWPIRAVSTLQSLFVTLPHGYYCHCDRLSSSCHRLLNLPIQRRARQRSLKHSKFLC